MNRHEIHKPIFVLGNPRSGTTLLRLILTSHEEILIPPESEFIVKLYPKYGHIVSFSERDLKSFRNDLLGGGGLIDLEEQWEISLKGLSLKPLVGMAYGEVCASIYYFYADVKGLKGKKIWGDKNNAYGNYIDLLSKLYSGAKFIHIVRDGRGCLNSNKKLQVDQNQKYAPLLSKDAVQVACKWSDMVGRIERHMKQYVQPINSLTIRYEDLLESPSEVILDICDFLGIDFSEEMLLFHSKNGELKLEPSNFSWKKNTFQPIDPEKSKMWLKELSRNDICQFESVAGELLVDFGYELESLGYQGVQMNRFLFSLQARFREVIRHIRVVFVGMKKELMN